MSSKRLCVLVTEDEKQIVSVKLPAVAVGWMETLMPPHVKARLVEREIDLDAIKKKAVDSGMVPQLLFSMDSGNRTYCVSLE